MLVPPDDEKHPEGNVIAHLLALMQAVVQRCLKGVSDEGVLESGPE